MLTETLRETITLHRGYPVTVGLGKQAKTVYYDTVELIEQPSGVDDRCLIEAELPTLTAEGWKLLSSPNSYDTAYLAAHIGSIRHSQDASAQPIEGPLDPADVAKFKVQDRALLEEGLQALDKRGRPGAATASETVAVAANGQTNGPELPATVELTD